MLALPIALFLIVFLLAIGFSAFRSVIIATVVAFLLSFLDRRDRMGPREVWEALVAGARGVLPIAATTAAAGIIVAVVSLTGLGLKLAGLIVDLAGGSLALTAILAAVAVLILGLAVPVTASFIIAAADTLMAATNAELLAAEFPGLELTRPVGDHETLLAIDKARAVLGYVPQHSWRDRSAAGATR